MDVEFPRGGVPALYHALWVEVSLAGQTKRLALEVALHLGNNLVRGISMQPTDGVVRGAPVIGSDGPISVPVGEQDKGHVFNALGDPDLKIEGERRSIHREPRRSISSKAGRTCWRPAKVIDLLTPYVQGGKIGLFGGAGVGNTVLIQDDDHPRR